MLVRRAVCSGPNRFLGADLGEGVIKSRILPLLVTLVVGMATGAATAGRLPLSELRGGIMAQGIDEPGTTLGFIDLSHVQDLNLEVLFEPLATLGWIGAPRPTLGTTINFNGLASQVYAGLTWHTPLFRGPVFLEGVFGVALNDGRMRGAISPARNLGSPLLFHEAVNLGYNFSAHANAMLTLEHSSSAGLCKPNRGLTELGLRFGYKF